MRSERERKLEKISFEYDSFGMAENIDDLFSAIIAMYSHT